VDGTCVVCYNKTLGFPTTVSYRESSVDDRAGQMGRHTPQYPDRPVRNFLAPLPVKSESAWRRRLRARSRKKVGAERKLWRREPTMGKAVSLSQRVACTCNELERRRSPGDGGVARAISATVQVQVGAFERG